MAPPQTNYYRYPDGSVAHLYYPGGTYLRRDYTARGQLAAVGWDDDENNWWKKLAAYTYLQDGKVDHVDHGNGTTTFYGYDQRGFVNSLQERRGGDLLSSRSYTRDDRDRIVSFQKAYNPGVNPLENGRGDRFRYDEEGQLVEAWYNAADPANSGGGNTRYDFFNYDALGNRRGSDYVASRGQWLNFARKDNGLNQYRGWFPYSYTNYDDDIGNGWGSPGAANGVLMQDGWVTAGFNALNQPMYISSPTYYGTPNWMYFGFDPLGRCVKRWVSDSGDIYSNPATYYHYDGWNLLQEGTNAWGPSRVYVHGNRVDEIVWSYNTFTGEQGYHNYDARGHCTLLTDSAGNILEQYEYDAFGWPYFFDANGNAIGAYDPVQNLWEGYSKFGNRFLFTGREWIADLKLYDYRNRMYQPELGRFLQPDPKHFAAGDYNLYRYCHNDPINKNDPLGLAPGDPFGSPEAAARDVHNFINPTSIKENAEYGSVIYQVGDKFYASPTFTNRAQTHVTLGTEVDKSRIPAAVRSSATRKGDYHSHGDYSKNLINPKDGTSKIVRASKSENPESDHPSEGDSKRAGIILQKVPDYRLFLGTPSGELKKYDSKKDKPL